MRRRLALAAAGLCAIPEIRVAAAGPLDDLSRFHRYDEHLAVAGQPSRAQIAAIAAAGTRAVLNLAATSRDLPDEQQLVEAAGMAYHHIPIDWENPPLERVLAAVRVLEQYRGQPVLVHCFVASRASFVAHLYRVHKLGRPEPAELATLQTLWRRNRGFELENSPQWEFLLDDARKRLTS
jgi:uncharacterized protein (TIGR01244 family)